MKTHTNQFKENIKKLGRELDSKITYTINNVDYELGSEELNSISLHYEGKILKSIMKQLDIDSNVEIPTNTEINFQFGILVGEEYEYLDYGNFIVNSVEKKEDTNSFQIKCYDKMLYSMVDYVNIGIEYPITIKNYLSAICNNLGLNFANENDTFVNSNKYINRELYLDGEGNSLGYKFRDVLDEIAQVTASIICINNDDELEIKYISQAISKNLFNKKASTLNVRLASDGNLFNDNYYLTSDFIKILPSTKYSYSRGRTGGGSAAIAYYDNEKTFISRTQPITTTTNLTVTVTTPSNAYFCRICDLKTLIDTMQLEKGAPTPYEPFEDTIDEEFLKNVNVNFGEKFGPVNSIVLTRSADSDMVYLQDEESIAQNGLTEIKISENQIMNFNDRDTFLPEILNQLNGLEYYINDFSSTGICYYEIGDMYNIQVGENIYNCLMFNNEINITQGLEEIVHCDRLSESKSDYTKADKTDRRINQTTLMVDKQQGTIEGLVSEISELNGVVNENFTKVYQDISNVITSVQTAGGNNLLKNSVMFAYNEDGEPDEWDFGKTTITYNNEQVLYSNEAINVGGTEGLTIQSDTEALNAGSISAHSFTLKNGMVRQKIIVTPNTNENDKNFYAFSTKIKKNLAGSCYVKIYNSNEEYKIELNSGQEAYYSDYSIQSIFPTLNYFIIEFYGSEDSGATFTDNMFTVGEYPKQWQQATGEIMNTQVNININGVLVKSAQYAGNYTIMSPLEFAGYANVNGVITKVFSLNNDVTEVEKLEARKQIQMPPIKIVPITSGDMQGWAFVPIAGGDE